MTREEYRPFKTRKEYYNEALKHPQLYYIRNKTTKVVSHITYMIDYGFTTNDDSKSFKTAFEQFEFLDGTPFGIGIKEE